METEKNDTSSEKSSMKSGLESLSKDELITKYKQLLSIAKKAKQAKDEYAEENRLLKENLQCNETQKEADKKALMTMKETLEQFTNQKLQLSLQLDELRQKHRSDNECLDKLRIENESLRRQMDSLTMDNESLLNDMDAMENQLKKVNLIGIEQKKHLELLELDVNRLKERESHSASLEQRLGVCLAENKSLKDQENLMKKSLEELTEKYLNVKQINSEQRHKFNGLKERFVDVLRKLKKLKECKRVLLETQHEYADAVSKWQNEIIQASRQLCSQLHALKAENDALIKQMKGMTQNESEESKTPGVNIDHIAAQLRELGELANIALKERQQLVINLESNKVNENSKEETTMDDSLEVQSLKEGFEKSRQAHQELQAELARVVVVKAELEEKVRQLTTSMETQTEMCTKLNEELNMLKQKNSNVELKENGEKYENLAALQKSQEEEFCTEKTRLANQLEELRKAHEIQFGEHEELKAKLDASTKEAENKDESCQLLLKEKSELEIKLEQQIEKYNALQQEASVEHNKMSEETVELIANLEQKVQELSCEIEMKTEAYKNLEEKLQLNEQNLLEAVKARDDLEILRLNFEELQSQSAFKEREHTDLLDEMRELNEALKKRGDVISRQEEKLKDLNAQLKRMQQFEYVLKEKEQLITQKDNEIKQITEDVKSAQAKVQNLEVACTRSEEHISAITEELQNLRQNSAGPFNEAQCDTMSIASTTSRIEERLREVDDSLEERYTKLRTLAVKLKKKLQEQQTNASELEAKLKTQEEANETHAAALLEQQKTNETLMAENKKLKSSRKQANVLNLEIEAAEKSLNEATAKLSTKTSELNELKNIMDAKETTIVQLRQQISILEVAKEAECEHAKELKSQIDLLQTQIKAAVHSKQTALDSNKDLEQTQERLKLEIEDLKLQISESESKQSLRTQALNTENIELSTKLAEMEANLVSTQTTLKTTERALADLRGEHSEYKLKVQAVLRKNQMKDTTRERELEDELIDVRQKTTKLENYAFELNQKLGESEKELEILREDYQNLQHCKHEQLKLIDELRLKNENLQHEQRTQLQDILRQHRQQLENLDVCHKQQIESMERQIEQLKTEHTKSVRQAPLMGAVDILPPNASVDNQRFTEPLLMEREDAEGSEEANAMTLSSLAAKRKISNASSSRRSTHELMPLDELLNAPINTLNSETLLTTNNIVSSTILDDSNANVTNEAVDILALQAAKERLQIQDSRVRHLTALLAENEQDLARLTQMNDMLKEELRRQERSVEREQHMHNSEYLKNVIIKFLTLNSVDEKTRLVPVLNTILKLSRNEVEMLNCVAKGQKVAEVNTRSWSNFLPSWGGGSGN